MAILVNKHTRVILQGAGDGNAPWRDAIRQAGGTGRARCVAGVAYGAAELMPPDLPLFEGVREAKARTGASASVVCVPPHQAAAAIEEAIDADLALVVCLTEGVPRHDMERVQRRLRYSGTRLLGDCTGVATPGEIHIGPMPGHALRRGRIGVVSCSAPLVGLAAHQLAAYGLGESTVVGLGGQAAGGLQPVDVLRLFDEDPGTDAVLLAGGVDEDADADCARWIARHMRKPVVLFGHEADPRPGSLRTTRDPAALGALVAAVVEPQWLPFD